MPFFVLAFGLAMSVLGVLAIVLGYPIIQVERGWAAVIAGATLVAGGAVTSALGLVLRAIGTMSHAIVGAQIGARVAPAPGLALRTHGETPAFDDPIVSSAPAETALPAAEAPRRPEVALPEPAEPALETAIGTSPAEQMRHEPAPAAVHDVPAPPAPAPHEAPPSAPAIEDWLDQSFAEFDRANTTPAFQETLSRERGLQPAPEPAPPLTPEPEPEPEPASAISEPMPPEPPSAVIGRYESEGTSYVMYADGSIDAQSAAGVYRFASMSELKAFIEG